MITDFPKSMYRCLRCWNLTAIKCYQRGCNCKDCDIIKGLEIIKPTNCQMKKAVLALVRKFGAPIVKDTEIIQGETNE